MAEKPETFSRAIENLIADFRGLPTDDSSGKTRRTTDLTTIIDELLVKYRISHDSIEHSIRERWAGIVGEGNASYSHPLAVERQQLVVLVSHAVVRNELFLHRAAIVSKLKRLPGCSDLKGIFLRSA